MAVTHVKWIINYDDGWNQNLKAFCYVLNVCFASVPFFAENQESGPITRHMYHEYKV